MNKPYDKLRLTEDDTVRVTNPHLNNFDRKLKVKENHVYKQIVSVKDGHGSTTSYFYTDIEPAED